jgi:signal transduction histidine kinase
MQSTARISVALERKERDASGRWKSIWHAAYFGGLALASLLASRPHERAHGTSFGATLALATGAAAWHFVAAVRRPAAHRKTKPMLVWTIGAIAINTALVAVAPVYLFAASFLYAQVFQLLPARSSVVASAAFTLALFVPLETTLGHTFAMVMLGLGIGTSLLSGFIVEVVEQNRERRRTIERLREAEATIASLQREAGRHEERARIARELHDTVAQDLLGIALEVEKLASDDARLSHVRTLSKNALADARGLIVANRPRQLGGELASALRTLGVETNVDGDVVVGPEQEAVLFRIAQEAVTNAKKHAPEASVAITVSMAGTWVHLDVVDDGPGFDLSAPRRGDSFGLESMRTRARGARGLFTIESAPGEGTAVHVELPALS